MKYWSFIGIVFMGQSKAFYYQIPTPRLKINKVVVENIPFVIYEHNQTLFGLPDECRHMGASLGKGWLEEGSIVCPYHGMGFKGKEVLRHKKDVFMPASFNNNLVLPYYPPEEEDASFVFTGGQVLIPTNQQIVTENVLDMLHVSYVHSFGRNAELPTEVSFEQLSPFFGRSRFLYRPFEWTISHKLGRTQNVVVENEFHLPSTTITRVIAGKVIKTVMTRSTPVSDGKTMFFFRVYRNFWKHSQIPFLTVIGDRIMDILMWRTIQEDMGILKEVYPDRCEGFFTPFDITIQKYRESLKNYKIRRKSPCEE